MPWSRRKKITWITIGTLTLIITIIRETGTFNISFYRSYIDSNSHVSWYEHNTSATVYSDNEDSLLTTCNYASVGDVPVQVWCDDYLVGDTVSCPQLSAFITDVSYGFLYSPLCKRAHFSATVEPYDTIPFYTKQDSLLTVRTQYMSARMKMEGTIMIYGLCSARTARELLKKHIAEEMYKLIAAHAKEVR